MEQVRKENNNVTDEYMVRLQDITMKYGDFFAIDGISLDIKKGEVIGLIGANGAGKTTLSEIIVGLTKQTSGEVHYGFEYDKIPQEKIGMQFQDATFPSGILIRDIIQFARGVHKIPLSESDIKKLLDIFQITEFYNKKPKSLSGGQRQKLNILLSILHRPEVIVLDELSTGLDISARREIIKFTKRLIKDNNMTAIMISHHMGEIEAMCDRLVILDHGKIKKVTTVEEMKKGDGLSAYLESLIKKSQDMTGSLAIDYDGKAKEHKVPKFFRRKKGGE